MSRLRFVILGFACLVLPLSAAAQDWSAVVGRVTPSILRLTSVDAQGGGVCSSVVIHKEAGYVVTAAHCVPVDVEARSLAILNRHVDVVRLNRVLDLAVLRVEKLHKVKGLVNVPVRQSDAPIGTAVAVLGYAMGAEHLKAQFGHVSDTTADLVGGSLLADAQVFPGDSGGAVIDTSGELVAVTSAVLGRLFFPNAFSVGSNGEALRLFVEDYLPAPAVTR